MKTTWMWSAVLSASLLAPGVALAVVEVSELADGRMALGDLASLAQMGRKAFRCVDTVIRNQASPEWPPYWVVAINRLLKQEPVFQELRTGLTHAT